MYIPHDMDLNSTLSIGWKPGNHRHPHKGEGSRSPGAASGPFEPLRGIPDLAGGPA